MARATSFSRDLKVVVDRALSPKTRSAMIANTARAILREGQDQNRAALGTVPKHETIVDRVPGAPLESVNPDRGVIVFEFEIGLDVFDYIGRLLVMHSPVLTGEYQRSHRLYADGAEVLAYSPDIKAEEWVFTTPLPFARRIERGSSDQAPDGVYEAVAAMANKRFGNIASIKFTFRNVVSPSARGKAARGDRQPAISVRLR